MAEKVSAEVGVNEHDEVCVPEILPVDEAVPDTVELPERVLEKLPDGESVAVVVAVKVRAAVPEPVLLNDSPCDSVMDGVGKDVAVTVAELELVDVIVGVPVVVADGVVRGSLVALRDHTTGIPYLSVTGIGVGEAGGSASIYTETEAPGAPGGVMTVTAVSDQDITWATSFLSSLN